MGLDTPPSKLSVVDDDDDNKSLDFSFDAATKILVVRKPELSAMHEWTIQLS
jgi:hypothetical protein